jgi:prophage regulatory protein
MGLRMVSLPTTSLRPRQAAEFLGIGESTFWRWAKERADFPKPIKLGARTTVYPLDKLVAWRDAQGQRASA